MASVTTFEDNQFAYRKQTRNQAMVTATRKTKRHIPLWLLMLIILVIVGSASAVGFVLTHPSPHRSPTAVATNFAQMVGSDIFTTAASDIDPADRAAALKSMESNSGVPGGAFDQTHATKLASSNENGTTASVVLQACNSSLACSNLPAIPCKEINGLWYVSWTPLLQSVSAAG